MRENSYLFSMSYDLRSIEGVDLLCWSKRFFFFARIFLYCLLQHVIFIRSVHERALLVGGFVFTVRPFHCFSLRLDLCR